MKKNLLVIFGLMLAVTLVIFIWNPVAALPGILAATVAAPAASIVFNKDDKGNIVMTEEQLTDALRMQSDITIKKFKEEFGINVVPNAPPGMGGAPVGEERKWDEVAGETKMQRYRRVQSAYGEIKGGRLVLEKAPKEIKAYKYFQALLSKDMATVRALGEASWETSGMKALTEGVAADGGNLVPVEFATDLIYALEQYSAYQDCTFHDMKSNELDLRTVTTKPIVYQVAEKVAATEAGTKFGKPQLLAKAFSGLQVISNELSDDNNITSFYQDLIDLFAEAFNMRISYEIFVGSTFTGIFGSATPVTVTLDSVSIKDITYKKLVDMTVALSPGKIGSNAKWYMHRVVFGYIAGMVDDQGRPIVTNPWDPMNRTLFGFPVVLDEGITNAGTIASGGLSIADPTDAAATAYIAFGNLKWVHFGMRKAVTADILKEGTVAGVNLGEQRSKALVIDTRWGVNVATPGNLAILKTHA